MVDELAEEGDKLGHATIIWDGGRLLAHNVGDSARVGAGETIGERPEGACQQQEGLVGGTLVGASQIVASSTLGAELAPANGTALTSQVESASTAATSIKIPKAGEGSACTVSLTHGHCGGKALHNGGTSGSGEGEA